MRILRKEAWLLWCAMMLLAGCGGGTREGRFAGTGSAKSAPAAPASVSGEASVDARASTAPSASSAASTRDSLESSSRERPGLGTAWGESRTSRVHDVSFVRESHRPFAVATFHYDDRKGVDALAARHTWDPSGSIDAGNGAVNVSLRDANGEPLEAVYTGDRTFVVGHAGERYTIVLQNRTSHRLEAVATVDGLDVVNGKDGSFDNRGYVLSPFATVEIEGFRQSAGSVAAFRFSSVSDAYAAQMGKARNVGVIGVAFFDERGDSFSIDRELRLRDSARPFPADLRFAGPPPGR